MITYDNYKDLYKYSKGFISDVYHRHLFANTYLNYLITNRIVQEQDYSWLRKENQFVERASSRVKRKSFRIKGVGCLFRGESRKQSQ